MLKLPTAFLGILGLSVWAPANCRFVVHLARMLIRSMEYNLFVCVYWGMSSEKRRVESRRSRAFFKHEYGQGGSGRFFGKEKSARTSTLGQRVEETRGKPTVVPESLRVEHSSVLRIEFSVLLFAFFRAHFSSVEDHRVISCACEWFLSRRLCGDGIRGDWLCSVT